MLFSNTNNLQLYNNNNIITILVYNFLLLIIKEYKHFFIYLLK
jgi:hypothetical protein